MQTQPHTTLNKSVTVPTTQTINRNVTPNTTVQQQRRIDNRSWWFDFCCFFVMMIVLLCV